MFDPDLPKVLADEHELAQVFLNIVTNAEQAMGEAHQDGRFTIRGSREEEDLLVSFADTGPGIAAETLRTIFDPFFTTKIPGQGTGLGLSICRSLAQEQGGKIWAESEIGKGATFHVQLPIYQPYGASLEGSHRPTP